MYKQFYKKEYQNCGFCGAKNPIVKGRSLVYCVHCHSKLEWYRNKCMDLARYTASFNQERKVVSMMNIISGFNIHTEYGEGARDAIVDCFSPQDEDGDFRKVGLKKDNSAGLISRSSKSSGLYLYFRYSRYKTLVHL